MHLAGGGTFIRLIQEGHKVSVAYQTSGSIAVSDEEALRFAEFASSYLAASRVQSPDPALQKVEDSIRRSLRAKRAGEVEISFNQAFVVLSEGHHGRSKAV